MFKLAHPVSHTLHDPSPEVLQILILLWTYASFPPRYVTTPHSIPFVVIVEAHF
jgi:hypothetical protein